MTRDDLDDEGAWLYAEVVRQIHALNPNTGVENLVPDFSGKPDLLEIVFESRPEVFAHNIETVPRIFKRIRPAFRYDRSLDVIRQAWDYGLVTKSNLILGMGETYDEIQATMQDLRDAGCDILTITQYLRPGPLYHPIERWVKPEEFLEHSDAAKEMGFSGVMSRGQDLPENLKHLAETTEGSTAQEASSLLERYGASQDTPVVSR